MLQKKDNKQYIKFLNDVEMLGFRFPGKVIAERTGESKGNVSKILNRKLAPSENFLTTFYEKFSKELMDISNSPPQKIDDREYLAAIAASLQELVAIGKRIESKMFQVPSEDMDSRLDEKEFQVPDSIRKGK